MKIVRIVILPVLLFCLLAPATAQSPEFRAIWVDAFHAGIRSPQECEQLVADAKAGNFNALIVQVRRRGDSLYTKSLEPPLEDPEYDPSFDGLACIIDLAHRNGIEVHAWANAMPVWRDQAPPRDQRHVFNQHGPAATGNELWLTSKPNGELKFPVGYFLDPGHPAAAEHVVQVYINLVRNYDLDGIHFDYIRYPEVEERTERGSPVGYNAVSLERFRLATGRSGMPAAGDEEWIRWRRQQVTQLVRRVYLEAKAINPRIKVSAALIPWGRPPKNARDFENVAPMQRVFQDWHGWLKEGILDMAIPMNYARESDPRVSRWFDGWIEFEKKHTYGRQLVVGLGSYLNNQEQVLAQLARVRKPTGKHAAGGVSFFSYWSLYRIDPPTASAVVLAAETTPPPAPPVIPPSERLQYLLGSADKPGVFAMKAAIPERSWIAAPAQGAIAGYVRGGNGKAHDGALVQVRRSGWNPFRGWRTVVADGNGFFGFTRLDPGRYEVKRNDSRTKIPLEVKAGVVARAELAM